MLLRVPVATVLEQNLQLVDRMMLSFLAHFQHCFGSPVEEAYSQALVVLLKKKYKSTVALQWLEDFWDHKNMFGTGVVIANKW